MKRGVLNGVLSAAILALLSGCAAHSVEQRVIQAQDLALSASMQRRDITVNGYALASWQKITRPGEDITIYIEGDGFAWRTRRMPSANPTPKNPLALRLAALDDAPNVVYLARPCQYTLGDISGAANSKCSVESWTAARYSPDIMATMNAALDGITRSSPDTKLHLIGFSGGGNIAAVLSDQRDDVTSLRSVAGNLDIAAFTDLHGVSAMPVSVSAADASPHLASIAQIHFIGAQDDIVPIDIFLSYQAALGASDCVQHRVVDGVGHSTGWEAIWPDLLKDTPTCP